MNLILGVVTNNYDQDHPAMVQVSIPDFASGGVETAWLPVASPYAGKACGA